MQPNAHFNPNHQEVITSQQGVLTEKERTVMEERQGLGTCTGWRGCRAGCGGGREGPSQNLGLGSKPSPPQGSTLRKSRIPTTQPCIVVKEAKSYFYTLLAKVKSSLLSQKHELPPRQISWEKGATKIDFLMDTKTVCLCFRSSNFDLPPSLSIILLHLSRLTEAFYFTEICFCTQPPVKQGTCSSDKHLWGSLISAFVFFTANLIQRLQGESQRLMTPF